MSNSKHVLEVQIRQNSTDVVSNSPEETNVTINKDTFTDVDLTSAESIRVYLEDDHDVALDVQIEHTHTEDDDYSGVIQASTVSLTSGSSKGTAVLEGPVGKIRAKILASQAAAVPTTGEMRIEALAKG